MHTMVKTGAVAATLLAAVAMTTTPSDARCRNCGAAAAGFIGGLAVGAIASNAYNNSYYGPGYGYGYAPSYGYAPGYAYYGGPGYVDYGGPAYYDSYAYAPAPSYRYRATTNYGSARDYYNNESLMNR